MYLIVLIVLMTMKKFGKKEEAVKYRDRLDQQERERYMAKLKPINNEDPYEVAPSVWSTDVILLPKVTYPDIVNYLIFSPSPYTSQDLKSYKGLDAYNQFVCGWVRERITWKMNEKCVVKAKVFSHISKLNIRHSIFCNVFMK